MQPRSIPPVDPFVGVSIPSESRPGVVFRIERQLPSPFDTAPKYAVKVSDHFWHWLYLPLAHGSDALARLVGKIQQDTGESHVVFDDQQNSIAAVD